MFPTHNRNIKSHILIWFADLNNHCSFACKLTSPPYRLVCSFNSFNSHHSLVFDNNGLSYVQPAYLLCNLPTKCYIFPFIFCRAFLSECSLGCKEGGAK